MKKNIRTYKVGDRVRFKIQPTEIGTIVSVELNPNGYGIEEKYLYKIKWNNGGIGQTCEPNRHLIVYK